MATQKQKFELIERLKALGFTYDEAQQLRRIEMTLHRWAEEECNGTIQREESLDVNGWDTGNGKPYRQYGNYVEANDPRSIHFIADREAGALRRLKAIVDARNERQLVDDGSRDVLYFHQTDPRGCALHLIKRCDLIPVTKEEIARHSGPSAIKDEASRLRWRIEQSYSTRGLAVCA